MKVTYLIAAIVGLGHVALAGDPCDNIDTMAANYEEIARACNAGMPPPAPQSLVPMTLPTATSSSPPPKKSDSAKKPDAKSTSKKDDKPAPKPTDKPSVVMVAQGPTGAAASTALPSDWGKDGALVGACVLYEQKPGYKAPSYEYAHSWYDQCVNVCKEVPDMKIPGPGETWDVACVGQGQAAEEPSMRGKRLFS